MGDGGGHCGGCIKGHVYGYAITWTRVGLSGHIQVWIFQMILHRGWAEREKLWRWGCVEGDRS